MEESSQIIKLNNEIIELSSPIIMAIMNITPDSFYSGNRYMSKEDVLKWGEKAIEQGAKIIDIGAQSTRPFAELISEEEEKKRLSLALEMICKHFPKTSISIDTFRASIAKFAVEEFGVGMINDVSGGELDKNMFATISEYKLAYVLTHSRGNAQTMTQMTDYADLLSDVFHDLQCKSSTLISMGIHDIIIDPGFGFAKTKEQNFKLLKNLSLFRELKLPLLCGISRKSMIYNTLDITAEESLNGTTAAHVLALMGGAQLLRVHDVKEAKEAIRIFNAYKES
jgi:dihydropteroate synthase